MFTYSKQNITAICSIGLIFILLVAYRFYSSTSEIYAKFVQQLEFLDDESRITFLMDMNQASLVIKDLVPHAQEGEKDSTPHVSQDEKWKKFAMERNLMSRMMNSIAQSRAKLLCEMKKLSHISNPVSDTGGWCEETATWNTYNHMTDTKLITGLVDFFSGKRVASFGDGRGHYKKAFDETGKLACYDAYDGGPYYDKVSEGRVKYMDLTLPQYGLPVYDWVMSLEVAEHVPKTYEGVYLDNIVRHAKEGIVLSWSIPGQMGHYHVNNRPLGYVISTLQTLGFKHDPEMSAKIQNTCSYQWLKRNINVYRRISNSVVDENDA